MSKRIINGLPLEDVQGDMTCPKCGHHGTFELLDPAITFGDATFFCPQCLTHLMASGLTVTEYIDSFSTREHHGK